MGDYTNNLDFKVISYCKEDNIPVFYGDVVGVNSKIDNEKKDAAIKLGDMGRITEKFPATFMDDIYIDMLEKDLDDLSLLPNN